jgi:diaminopimelate epimerase
MSLHFHKMHGAGNDFVLIDARGGPFALAAEQAASIADRHLGIGCDQILVLREADIPNCLLRYEIWNADGSPAAQCGNGARCVGLFLDLNGECGAGPIELESPSGPVSLSRCPDGEFEVTMGVPDFTAASITPRLPTRAALYQVESPWGMLELGTVSMGNPHALLMVADIDDKRIPAMGAFISTHQAFPDGCNAGFAQLESRTDIRLRVVERGAGETLACGSGACAAMAILRRSERVAEAVRVRLPGGQLVIKWRGGQEPLTMKGPAEHVFRGIMND